MEQQFASINSEDTGTIIESMCPNCEENGQTHLLLCNVPFFKDIIICSFKCMHCGYANNEIQSAAQLDEHGLSIRLTVSDASDLNREVVKSEHATIRFPELDFEIPRSTQKGSLNTVEGILQRSADELGIEQPYRYTQAPEIAAKIDEIIVTLRSMASGARVPFTLILDDPSGNSFISFDSSTYTIPENDPRMNFNRYPRTLQQMIDMGYATEDTITELDRLTLNDPEQTAATMDFTKPLPIGHEKPTEEAIGFPTTCYACRRDGMTNMWVVTVPHFKEVVIMAFTCEYCGAKSNEIKGGGEISPNGRRVILTAQSPADLARELYKSETCTVEIPELELELAAGTIGSTFTIVEGLVTQIRDSLARTHFMVAGDSAEVPEEAIRFRQLLDQLDACAKGNMFPYTIILDDPLANCFIYGQEEDPNLVFETYERTEEQNIDFGISDMNTENYVET